ncbi:MAG: hypothetical protein R3B84_08595 [Zavarzinella sp.]
MSKPFAYKIYCQTKNCGRTATHKVAARWSDGNTAEMKTYFLSCESCVEQHLLEAIQKQQTCKLLPEETLELPTIFQIN